MNGQHYHLRPSYRLGMILGGMEVLAVVCIAILPWSWWLKGSLLFISLLYFYPLFRLHVLRNMSGAIIEFGTQNKGIWQIKYPLQPSRAVILSKQTFCTRHIVILHFNDLCTSSRIQSHSLFLLADSLKAKEFKSLRRQLRMMG